ncbi:MAG: hypothetical protein AB7F89_23780 [Pirellulaceae bacterium]
MNLRAIPVGLLLLICLVVGLPPIPAKAAPTWVEVRAPFNGYWDRWGYSPPSSHNAYGAEWATDYYQSPNATGYWYPVSSGGDSVTSAALYPYNNCGATSWTTAGISYNIQLANGSGTLGYFQWGHVYPTGSGFYNGQNLAFGEFIGYTYQWGFVGGCWEVTTPGGVHWHIAGDNYGTSTHSCYAPNATGAFLNAYSGLLGAVGANATSAPQSCW